MNATHDAAVSLYWLARTQMREMLRVCEHGHGLVPMGVVADGMLAGIVDVMTAAVGPQATYAALQRVADDAAKPLVTEVNHERN